MVKFILRLLPALFFWGIFGYIILQIPYPETLTQASIFLLLSFFIPLFLALTFTFNLLFNFYLRSIILSFGMLLLLILKALNSLNLVSVSLTVISIALMFSYFKKSARLTSRSDVPKLKNLSRRKHV